MNSYRENFLILKDHFKDESSPVNWAREGASAIDDGFEPSKEYHTIEHARFHLLVHIKQGTDQSEWTKEEALEALLLCVKYDRANALHLMKTVRDDPHCPRGFPWVTEENLIQVQNHPKLIEKGLNMARCSITSKYLKFAQKFEADDKYLKELNELLETTYPEWV